LGTAFEVGTVPVVYIRFRFSVEALAGVGIAADVQAILVQGRPEQLDLRPRRAIFD
jgi:hypothetical protein